MQINALLEEINELAKDFNSENGILTESLEFKFADPVIESFDPILAESITTGFVESMTISDDLNEFLNQVTEAVAEKLASLK